MTELVEGTFFQKKIIRNSNKQDEILGIFDDGIKKTYLIEDFSPFTDSHTIMVQDELNPVENFHEMNEEDFVNMFNRHLFISNKKKELLLNFDTSSRFAFLGLAVKDHAHMHGYNVKENKQVGEDTSFKIESNKYGIETGLV